ncbi:MAG: hypothetical protein ABI634_11290 [Acidobacteriota bacterium]
MFVRSFVCVLVVAMTVVAGHPLVAQSRAVKGSMTVSGKVSQLSHVRAFTKKVFGRPAVLLVFSDIALSAADAANDTKLSELGNNGTLHAMGILIGDDREGKKVAVSNEIYDQGFHGRMSIGGQETFETTRSDATSIAGHVFLKPEKKFDTGITFSYDVTFDAAIEP